ncbi:MAG TPA: hypothetical protein VMF68_14155, partial [Spirochaetia bacterium]|nr:hypothetical protein [Spirochaetia bacterium]
MCLFAGASARLLAQTSSQFPPGSGWAGTSGSTGSGDQDATVVLFFEIPDTTTGTLYFGIFNPGHPNPQSVNAPYDQPGTVGTSYWWLLGGTGALSDPNSQLLIYPVYPSTTPLAGTLLSSFTRTNEDETWVYFGGVSPSQGEHIGNKYYFKVVFQADPTMTGKNAFRADVSFSGSGTPSGVPGAQSFAYDWPVMFGTTTDNNPGIAMDIYPFVPSGTTGNLTVNSWDVDNGYASSLMKDNAGVSQGALNPGAPAPPLTTTNFPIGGGQANGSWHLNVVGQDSTTGTADDLAEVYFTNGATVLRAYSSPVPAQAADHVSSTYGGGTVPADGSTTGQVTFQLVDPSGNPELISRNVWVTLSGATARISAANATGTALPAAAALVTTDGNGLGWVKVTDTASETVTVTPVTNGTSGSDTLPGTNTTAAVPFAVDPPPALSSASNLTWTAGSATSLPTLTISDSGTANITAGANRIQVKIPASLSAAFDTTVTAPTFGGSAAGKVNATVNYLAGVLRITVTSNFLVTDTLTISGLAFTSASSASSGSLTLSYDAGATFPVSDDKVYTVANPFYTWTGGGGTSWATGTSWSPAGPPPAGADVDIPSTGGTDPVLAGATTVGNLTIESGAALTTGANQLTVNGSLTNAGTLTAGTANVLVAGNVNFTGGTYTAGSGTFTMKGGTSQQLLSNGNALGAFAVSTSGTTVHQRDALTVSSLTTASGTTLDLNGHALADTGASSLNGTISNAGSAASFSVSGTTTLTGATSITTNGGSITFSNTVNGGSTLSLAAGAGSVTFAAAATVGQTTSLTSLTVSSSSTTSLRAVKTTGAQSYTAATSITLNGAATYQATTAANITFSGPVLLAGGAVGVTSANGAISFGSTVDGAQALTLTAGTGTVGITGAVGGGTALASLSVASSTTTSLAAVRTSGAQSYTAATSIMLNGTYQTTGAAQPIGLSGPVILGGSSTFTTAGGAVTLSSTLNATA